VVDGVTQRPVSEAEVTVEPSGRRALTDARGEFVIPGLEPGLYTVRASSLGYSTAVEAEVRVQSSRSTFVLLEVEARAVQLEGIVVEQGAFSVPQEAPVSASLLSPAEVRRTPGGLQDISRSLLSLPGVIGGVDNRNDLLVRGGGPGENAYYLDGIRIPQINHFATQGATGGALGLVNVDFIREAEFYRGAFPVRYPDALSSVLVIENRPGSSEGIRGDVTLGAAEAGLTLDGPLGENGNWLFSIRRSYLQFLFSALELPIRPDYWDAQTRLEFNPTDRDRITFVGIGALDEFDIVEPEPGDIENEEIFARVIDNDQKSGTIGGTWQRLVGDGVVRLVASHSRTDYQFQDLDADEQPVLTNRSIVDETPIRLEGEVRRWGVEWAGGLRLARESLDADVLQVATPGAPFDEDVVFESQVTSWNPGAFLQGSFGFAGDRAQLTAGVRMDDVGALDDGFSVSPRVALSLRLARRWTLALATGVHHQSPDLLSIAVEEDGEPVNLGLSPIRNVQAVAGVTFEPDDFTRVSVEGFWKGYSNYPVLRDDPRISLANLGGDFGFIGAEPLTSDGEGRAYGVELFGQRKLTGSLYALAAYTLSWSEFTGGDGVFKPSSWDVRHALDLTAGYRVGSRWEFGTRLRVLSGRPYTPFDEELSEAEFPITGRGVPDWDRLNQERTPGYLRLDVRGERRFEFDGWNGVLFLDLQNITGRDNPVGFLYTQDPQFPDNLRPIDGTAFLPFFGFSVEF
jgi:hypothetical protein